MLFGIQGLGDCDCLGFRCLCVRLFCCSGFKHCSVKKLVLFSVVDISHLLGILSVGLLVGMLGLVLFVR